MKRKIYLLISTLVAMSQIARAQTLSPFVVSPAGSYGSAGGTSLSYTAGELTMIQTFTSGSNILTQGFQQPEDFSVLVPAIPVPGFHSEVYPNPGSGRFHLIVAVPQAAKLQVQILDLLGQPVFSDSYYQQSGKQDHDLNLMDFSQGIYLVKLNILDLNDHVQYSSSGRIQLVR